jgi:hypothetical protein
MKTDTTSTTGRRETSQTVGQMSDDSRIFGTPCRLDNVYERHCTAGQTLRDGRGTDGLEV